MTKQRTECTLCGGATDGTPSGIKRHNRTARHQSAVPMTNAGSPEQIAAQAKYGNGDEPEQELTVVNDTIVGVAYDEHNYPVAVEPTVARLVIPEEFTSDDEQQGRYLRRSELQKAIAGAEKRIKHADAAIRWRETRAPHLVPKYEEAKTKEQEQVALWTEEVEQVSAAIAQWEEDRAAVVRDFWAGIEAEVEEMFSSSDLPLIITQYRGSFEVELGTGKVLTNKEGVEYPERLFGYGIHVSAPDRRWNDTITPAKVGWSSFSEKSVADARLAHRMHAVGIAIADYLDERVGFAPKD